MRCEREREREAGRKFKENRESEVNKIYSRLSCTYGGMFVRATMCARRTMEASPVGRRETKTRKSSRRGDGETRSEETKEYTTKGR